MLVAAGALIGALAYVSWAVQGWNRPLQRNRPTREPRPKPSAPVKPESKRNAASCRREIAAFRLQRTGNTALIASVCSPSDFPEIRRIYEQNRANWSPYQIQETLKCMAAFAGPAAIPLITEEFERNRGTPSEAVFAGLLLWAQLGSDDVWSMSPNDLSDAARRLLDPGNEKLFAIAYLYRTPVLDALQVYGQQLPSFSERVDFWRRVQLLTARAKEPRTSLFGRPQLVLSLVGKAAGLVPFDRARARRNIQEASQLDSANLSGYRDSTIAIVSHWIERSSNGAVDYQRLRGAYVCSTGFTVYRLNLLIDQSYRLELRGDAGGVSYESGRVVFDGAYLMLMPSKDVNLPQAYAPVFWGNAAFLMYDSRSNWMAFINRYNSGFLAVWLNPVVDPRRARLEPDLGKNPLMRLIFETYVKQPRPRSAVVLKGIPQLPGDWADYLLPTQIEARVLSIDYKTGSIEVNRGASDGLREGMYLYKLKDGRMRTSFTDDYVPVATWLVVQVEPHTADAKPIRNVQLSGLVAAGDHVTTRVWQTSPAD